MIQLIALSLLKISGWWRVWKRILTHISHFTGYGVAQGSGEDHEKFILAIELFVLETIVRFLKFQILMKCGDNLKGEIRRQ